MGHTKIYSACRIFCSACRIFCEHCRISNNAHAFFVLASPCIHPVLLLLSEQYMNSEKAAIDT